MITMIHSNLDCEVTLSASATITVSHSLARNYLSFSLVEFETRKHNTPRTTRKHLQGTTTISTMTEISLDSQKDVQFLKSNISLATREKLDTHLPPTAVPNIHSDTLRKRVEEMLDEVGFVTM